MKSDIETAREYTLAPIADIAAKLDIQIYTSIPSQIYLYCKYTQGNLVSILVAFLRNLDVLSPCLSIIAMV